MTYKLYLALASTGVALMPCAPQFRGTFKLFGMLYVMCVCLHCGRSSILMLHAFLPVHTHPPAAILTD